MQSLLLVSRHSPYGSSYAHEALDIALSAAAFDIAVTLLFMDDGVYQLVKGQKVERKAHTKNIEAVFGALPLYDITEIRVESESLSTRGINVSELGHDATMIESAQIAEFSQRFDRVLTI